MGQSVNCALGGYDHRFDQGENTKKNLEHRTKNKNWQIDTSNFKSAIHDRFKNDPNNPIYLALVTDAYSKKIMGYDVSDSLSTEGTLRALKMATRSRKYRSESLIHHSDRGFQYCSNQYQELLSKRGIICSMTESYDPYTNAVAERINGILKSEFIGYDRKLPINQMKLLVKNSIDIYNKLRPHYSCQMLTPVQMHKQRIIEMKTYKNKNSSENVLTAV